MAMWWLCDGWCNTAPVEITWLVVIWWVVVGPLPLHIRYGGVTSDEVVDDHMSDVIPHPLW